MRNYDGRPALPRRSDELQLWFELSYASFCTLPRVLMEAMPEEWQEQMAALLFEYDHTWVNWPEGMGSRVQTTRDGKLVKTPGWIVNYRHPDRAFIEELKHESS